jgi:hypothetical protein
MCEQPKIEPQKQVQRRAKSVAIKAPELPAQALSKEVAALQAIRRGDLKAADALIDELGDRVNPLAMLEVAIQSNQVRGRHFVASRSSGASPASLSLQYIRESCLSTGG